MKKQVRNKSQQEKETLVDWLKGIGLIGIPLWILLFFFCCVGINECQDRHSKKTPSPPPYRLDEVNRQHPANGTKRSIAPVQSNEKGIGNEDYYDVHDYNDGLDGEYNDIDYNDITDYHAD